MNQEEVDLGFNPPYPPCKRQRFLFDLVEYKDAPVLSGWLRVFTRMRDSWDDDEIDGLDDDMPRIPGGGTIAITMAQLAGWLGYDEIYFLDAHYSGPLLWDHSVARYWN